MTRRTAKRTTSRRTNTTKNATTSTVRNITNLTRQRDSIDARLATARETLIGQVRADATAMIERSGLTVNDIFGNRASITGTGTAMYRDPSNPSNTWTGRGRRPVWLVQQLRRRGVTLDQFRV
ncbi:MAG: H-NS family nucleoid-associated regulatory protein [Hyphomicrobiaceae bacterium]